MRGFDYPSPLQPRVASALVESWNSEAALDGRLSDYTKTRAIER